MAPTETDWQIRLHLYEILVHTGAAPTLTAIAEQFAISPLEAQKSLLRLSAAHAIVLAPESDSLLMANPLSALPTDYRVMTGAATLYANCAWDSLGIPAMLGEDARIEARHPFDGDVFRYAIHSGELEGDAGGFVHFAHPFRQWYDDIVDT